MDVAIRSIHLIAAAVWAGGLVFLGVAAGVARRTIPDAERIEFFRVLGRRFAILAAGAALLLAATGADMASDRLASWSALVDTSYGRLLLAKIILFALVVVEAALHSLVLGPRIGRLREALLSAPTDRDLALRLRRTAVLSGIVSALMLLQTIAILVLAADLVA
ncbi:MAG TPA: CopD family protein [Solirubrobacterales bacterium]